MALIHESKHDLLLGINRHALVPLSMEELYFSPVAEIDQTNAQLRLTVLPDTTYRGSEVIQYERLDVSKLPALITHPPRLPHRDTLYQLLPILKTHLGVTFTEEDVVDAPVVATENGWEVAIQAKPTSYGWVGDTTLQFYELPPLSISLTEQRIRW